MTFFNEVLLARNAQGTVESVIGRYNKRLSFRINEQNQDIIFDIIQSYQYKQSVRITENPVEQGFNINDHRVQEPAELTIRVGTSNIIDPLSAAATLDSETIVQAGSLQILGRSVGGTRIEGTYRDLLNAMQNSEVFDIDTPLGILRNFLIIGIENENNAESITTFEGTLTLKEIIVFESQTNVDTNLSGLNSIPTLTNPLLTATT